MKTTIKFIAIAAFTVPALFIFTHRASLQTKTVETAGQKFKSIKVLTDMPADEMGKVMNMMSASLGVDCKFCHASNEADFEKEGFENKDTARQMLKMTFELNKNYFDGRPEINCNSCHQGKSHPQPSFPLLPTIQAPPLPQPEKRPTADQILTNYETARGGKAAIEAVKSREVKAQRVEADGKTTEEERVFQRGPKVAIETVYPGNYIVREVYDGKSAMKFGNGSPIDLKPDERTQIERDAQIFANVDLKTIYAELNYRYVDRVEGRDAYVVQATTADKIRETLYFDVQSGHLIRRVARTPTILGLWVYQVDYLDYKDFGGVKMPATINFAVPKIRWTRRVLDVKTNVRIDEAKFAK